MSTHLIASFSTKIIICWSILRCYDFKNRWIKFDSHATPLIEAVVNFMFYNPLKNVKESMRVIMFSYATSASTSLSIFYIMHSKSAKAKCWAFPWVISLRRLTFFTLTLTLGSRCLCFWSVGECYCQNKSNSNHNWNSDKKNSVPCSGAYHRHHSICVLYENKKRKVK